MRKEAFTHYCVSIKYRETIKNCCLWDEGTGCLYSQIVDKIVYEASRKRLEDLGYSLVRILPISLENE